MTNKISYLDDGEVCVLTKDNVSFYDVNQKKINKKTHIMSEDDNVAIKVSIKTLCPKKYLSNQ